MMVVETGAWLVVLMVECLAARWADLMEGERVLTMAAKTVARWVVC